MRKPETKNLYEVSPSWSIWRDSGAKGSAPDVAIIGAGLMGRWHAHAARRLGARVIAVADPNAERARRLAGSGVPVFADADALFQDVRPAVVHLCSPSSGHGSIIHTAIAKGVNVFAEKPLAVDATETRSLYKVAQRADVLLCPTHQYAFQSAVEKCIKQRHRAGQLQVVDLRFFSAGGKDALAKGLSGIAADILPHPISIAQRIWPEQALETLEWTVTTIGTNGWQVIACVEGVTVRITLSLAARPTEASITLYGDKGAWDSDLFHGYARFRDGTASRSSKALRPFSDALSMLGHASTNLTGRVIRNEPAYPGLRNLVEAFYTAVAGHSPSPIHADHAIGVAELRDFFLSQTMQEKGSGE